MVAKAGGYFGRTFKGYQCVKQGNPRSLTIFKVVVDAVILHWVTVVPPSEAVTGGLGLTIIDLAEYFYAHDGLMAFTQTDRIHRAFDVLAGLFDRVDLLTNTAKTVGMVCQTCHVTGGMLEEAYKRRNSGMGPKF